MPVLKLLIDLRRHVSPLNASIGAGETVDNQLPCDCVILGNAASRSRNGGGGTGDGDGDDGGVDGGDGGVDGSDATQWFCTDYEDDIAPPACTLHRTVPLEVRATVTLAWVI